MAWVTAYENTPPAPAAAKVTTMADLMDRYSREVSLSKGGAHWEITRIMALRPAFTAIEASKIDGAMFAG